MIWEDATLSPGMAYRAPGDDWAERAGEGRIGKFPSGSDSERIVWFFAFLCGAA